MCVCVRVSERARGRGRGQGSVVLIYIVLRVGLHLDIHHRPGYCECLFSLRACLCTGGVRVRVTLAAAAFLSSPNIIIWAKAHQLAP